MSPARRVRPGRHGRPRRNSCSVSGYSGVGKSSVVHELHQRAGAGARASSPPASSMQFEHGIPYATLAQAFQQPRSASCSARSDAELEGWRAAACRGARPERPAHGQPDPGAGARRRRAAAGARAAAAGRAEPVPAGVPPLRLGVFARPEHPLVLFLDDLQWLDAATLDLVTDMLVTPRDGRNLAAGRRLSRRRSRPDHPLAQRRGGGAGIADARRPDPPPGSPALDQVEVLLADSLRTPPPAVRSLAELVFERTGGNPFFVIHFLGELVEEGLARLRAQRGGLAVGSCRASTPRGSPTMSPT